jgi:ABC-type transport system involved in multi-copper enzyme maturation permease subunit
VNGAATVARYTLVELSRRRLLLVFFLIGAGGIAILGFSLKIFASSFSAGISGGPGSTPLDPTVVDRYLQLQFVTNLISALGFFALLIAFAIGMTVIYHDLDSGSAVAIFSKPISRLAFTAGKLVAGILAMIAIVGLLSIESRLLMFLFGSGNGLDQTLWVESLAQVANAIALMLLVMALSTVMNNIVAAVVAFIYHGLAGVAVGLYNAYQGGFLGHNDLLHYGFTVLYWVVPHDLRSDAARELIKVQFALFPAPADSGFDQSQALAGVPGASGLDDIAWWGFVVAVFVLFVYYTVRRRQV